MAIQKATRKQVKGRTVGSKLSTSIASQQQIASSMQQTSNVMQSATLHSIDDMVVDLKKKAQTKAVEDATKGKLDVNSTQFTVYGEEYAKKANAIMATNYSIDLESEDTTARNEYSDDVVGYTNHMQDFYSKNTQNITDENKLKLQQQSRRVINRGKADIIKHKTNLINQEYSASITSALDLSQKELLQSADDGDMKSYGLAQESYVSLVKGALELELVTAPKAQAMIKNQYDEGTKRIILSDFNKLVDYDLNEAIEFANEFSTSKDTDMYVDGDRLYDSNQRDSMYSNMSNQINKTIRTNKTIKDKTRKYNNDTVKNTIDILQRGGTSSKLSQSLSYAKDEIDPILYEKLRIEEQLQPKRIKFANEGTLLRHNEIASMQEYKKSGKPITVEELDLIDSFSKTHKDIVAKIQSDPASVRQSQLSDSMVQYDGTNMVEFLSKSKSSVDSFAKSEGGSKNYFTNDQASLVAGQIAQMDDNQKLDFISVMDSTLGDDSRYVMSQLGMKEYQIPILSHTMKLDTSRATSEGILEGIKMLNLDKSLLPKEANNMYNILDKSLIANYTVEQRASIKDSVMGLAVSNNAGLEADNIDDSMVKEAYEQIVGKSVSSRPYFFGGKDVIAPWRGASYEDFEFKLEALTVDDMPNFVNKSKESVLNIIQEDSSDVVYKSVGVGEYNVYIGGVKVMIREGVLVEGTPSRTEAYILRMKP